MTFPNGLKIKSTIFDALLFIRLYYKNYLPLINTIMIFIIMIIALEIHSVVSHRLAIIQENTHDNNVTLQETTIFMKKAVTFGQIREYLPPSTSAERGF